ncbi:12864_t:CDS:2 [Ambispora leptoticha]|uniref:12864_t:CDS:1 n=1 Tax=Ambispora leptoticha TaxID=144679 RepID=A0A9N9BJI0_9GLOM|nr:12864_t:CDS:2 [Ambispora leptoticha]
MSISTTEHDAYLVENWDTETLVLYLQEQGLKLDDEDFAIIRKEKIDGQVFLDMTEEKFRSYGLAGGPAMKLAKEAKSLKTMPKRSFSSYHSLKEVLTKYGMESEGIEAIPLFTLPTYEIQDSDPNFKHCMAEILVRLKNYGPLHEDCLEAMRNEYVVAILHSALNITRKDTEKEFSMRSQQEVIGEESSGRVDYAIKVGISPGEISKGSKMPLSIGFTDDALEKDSNEYLALYNGVKKVLGVVVGLLRDRACVEKSPSNLNGRFFRRSFPYLSISTSYTISGRYMGLSSDHIFVITLQTRSMPLSNLRTFAYTILKNLNDEAVKDKEFTEIGSCTECGNEIITLIYEPFTILICGHIFHRKCIEKNFLLTQSNVCPISGCNKSVEPVVPEQRNSQSSGTSDLADLMSSDLKMNTPRITNDPIDTSPLLSGGNRDIDPILFESGTQKKRIMKTDSRSEEALPSESASESNTTSVNFLNLYRKIIDSEAVNKKTTQDLIRSYFHFGKAIEERYNYYRKDYPKRTSEGKVSDEIRKQLPNSVSESLLRKTKERALKIYDLFNELGEDKIKRIQTFTATTLANISGRY